VGWGGYLKKRDGLLTKVVEAVCVKLWGQGGKVQGSSNRQMEEE